MSKKFWMKESWQDANGVLHNVVDRFCQCILSFQNTFQSTCLNEISFMLITKVQHFPANFHETHRCWQYEWKNHLCSYLMYDFQTHKIYKTHKHTLMYLKFHCHVQTAFYLPLIWDEGIQSTSCHTISWRCILILSFHSWLDFLSGNILNCLCNIVWGPQIYTCQSHILCMAT